MPKVDVLNSKAEKLEEIQLNPEIFDVEVNEHCVYLVVKNILANKRQGTHSAKTRAEVRGGGRKPWRQKGTGRARQGSTRSPQWRTGGVVFAKKPRDFSYTTPKKVRRLALKSVLTSKLRDNELIILDDLKMDAIKTKELATLLKNIGAEKKALVVTAENDKNIALSARNIAGVKTAEAKNINVYDVLKYDKLVMTKKALDAVEEVLG